MLVGAGVVLGRLGAMNTSAPAPVLTYSSPPPLPDTVSVHPMPWPAVPVWYIVCAEHSHTL